MSTPAQVLDQLIADPGVNGQHVDVDHEFGGQCWDLVELFAEKCGVPREPWAIPLGPNGWASEAWTAFSSSNHMQTYFTPIPKGQQQKGDINVYSGHGQFVEGHICIEIGGSQVFEENADPDGSPAHIANRADTYLLGSLRIKQPQGGMFMVDKNLLFNYYRFLLGRAPDPDAEKSYIGQPADVVFQELVDSDEYKQHIANITSGNVTRDSVLNYINGNLK